MTESLEIIYTHENGQILTNLPLMLLRNTFLSKGEMEYQLLLHWEGLKNQRALKDGMFEKTLQSRLVKISTCIRSSEMKRPKWYGDWDGKFYYEYD